ncbi:two-component sensor kinase [Escherichia coli]|uniref:Two-component sensor kinase n=1 Tax=Escherichia coli TaxID=562 RepID=A0A376MTI6_ECOLX|nr:two-component sensor kinase [Escherichia coli]
MPVNIISARLFSVAQPRAAGGVGKRLLTGLARIAPDLDQVLVALDEPPVRTINNAPDSRSFKDKWRVQIQGCVVAAALCAVITLIAMQWLMAFDAANLVMLYLLGVVVVALFMDAGLRWLLPSLMW